MSQLAVIILWWGSIGCWPKHSVLPVNLWAVFGLDVLKAFSLIMLKYWPFLDHWINSPRILTCECFSLHNHYWCVQSHFCVFNDICTILHRYIRPPLSLQSCHVKCTSHVSEICRTVKQLLLPTRNIPVHQYKENCWYRGNLVHLLKTQCKYYPTWVIKDFVPLASAVLAN